MNAEVFIVNSASPIFVSRCLSRPADPVVLDSVFRRPSPRKPASNVKRIGAATSAQFVCDFSKYFAVICKFSFLVAAVYEKFHFP